MTHKLLNVRNLLVVAAVVLPLGVFSIKAEGALTYSIESAGAWPDADWYNAAEAAIQSTVARYNSYGDFGNHNVHVEYEAGVPTAEAGYLWMIRFGGRFPDEGVMMHEMAHFLGSGTTSQYQNLISGGNWGGPIANQLIQQFEGDQGSLNGDSAHFWPYGLNFPSEYSEINKQRQVAAVYAQRADMGIGPSQHPSSAKIVSLASDDPFGESGFNYKSRWSDGYFPHTGADYYTAQSLLRTPESTNSFTFGGDSLTLNNPAMDTGLLFKGLGSSGVVTFDELNFAGGWITHGSSNGLTDLFQLDGNLNVLSDSNIRANNGNINILANVHGEGDLIIHSTQAPEEGNRFVRLLSSENTFSGDIVIDDSRFELTAGANFRFKLGLSGESNAITGATARNTSLNGSFEFDFAEAHYNFGNAWQLVTAANSTYGPTFDLPGFNEAAGVWTNGSFEFDQATGELTTAPNADLNDDGNVNLSDWRTFIDNHLVDLTGFTPEEQAELGDLDRDGDNDFRDFYQFRFQYDALNGAGAFATMVGLAVPEPTTLASSLICVCLGNISRRRMRCF